MSHITYKNSDERGGGGKVEYLQGHEELNIGNDAVFSPGEATTFKM